VDSVSVPAGSEQVLLEVLGSGQVEGLTIKFANIPSILYGQLLVYIDGATSPAVISVPGAAALFSHGSTVDVGRFALPLTITVFDDANLVYGFSVTVPIRFSSSIRIAVYNAHTSSITVNYAAIVSLERQ